MNILLTNDDGYNSEGILLLKEKLQKYGKVVIVAPLKHMSAKSVSITLGTGFHVLDMGDNVFACDGTPADCVSFACNALNIDFDLVVSGCNNGFNISYDTMYSGTIGACLEALTYGVKAIAISCEFNFHLVDKYFDEVFKYVFDKKLLSNEYLLNVNFPEGDEVKGIKLSSLYYNPKQYDYYFIKEEDGHHAYRTLKTDYSDDKESDCYLVRHGYVSITPLNKSYFNKEQLKELKQR